LFVPFLAPAGLGLIIGGVFTGMIGKFGGWAGNFIGKRRKQKALREAASIVAEKQVVPEPSSTMDEANVETAQAGIVAEKQPEPLVELSLHAETTANVSNPILSVTESPLDKELNELREPLFAKINSEIESGQQEILGKRAKLLESLITISKTKVAESKNDAEKMASYEKHIVLLEEVKSNIATAQTKQESIVLSREPSSTTLIHKMEEEARAEYPSTPLESMDSFASDSSTPVATPTHVFKDKLFDEKGAVKGKEEEEHDDEQTTPGES